MKLFKKRKIKAIPKNNWARQEMRVTFRAQIMPGRDSESRTYTIEKVFPNGRVKLYDFAGEHQENEFETINFLREKIK